MIKRNNLTQAVTLEGGTALRTPDGIDEAMTQVKQLAVVRRQPADRENVPVNTGIFTGPKFDEYRLALLAELHDEVGEDRANDFTDILCTTGMVPNPTSSPQAFEDDQSEPEVVTHTFACVQALARKIYTLPPIYSNVHVNSESSTTFPYYVRGADGVAVKRAYHTSYYNELDRIYDELAAFDLDRLQSNKHHLPMFGCGTTGGRVQVRGMKEVRWQGNRIVEAKIKPNKCHNYLGEEMQMDMDIPGSKIFHTMRGRDIASQSSTTNQLAQEILSPNRNAMYKKGVWHASDWKDSLNRSRQYAFFLLWKEYTLRTYDFSRMDAHMRRPMFEAYLRGVQDAGWSDAYVNLARWIHFSPMLCPCDVKDAPYNMRFARVYGSERGALREFDAGQRSGQWDTDVSNKIYGTSAYFVAGLFAGLLRQGFFSKSLRGAKLVEMYRDLIDVYWDTFFEGLPARGDSMYIVGNCGDDNEVAFDSVASALKYSNALKLFDPYFEITEESFCNFLGNLHSDDGSSMAFEGKSWTNNLCPEQPIDSPRRKDFWPLGMRARDEHYASNPFYSEVLRPILERVTTRFYGSSWFDLVARTPLLRVMPAPKNAAEANFLWDPSVITYKYTADEISEEMIEASGAYFSVPAEEVERIHLKFRSN